MLSLGRAARPLSRAAAPAAAAAPAPCRHFSDAAAAHASAKTQIYVSRSSDPLANLSLEHRLLEKSHPESTVLILYVNRPCVVFGRNQNPWLETNLGAFADRDSLPDLELVRRRSGGGTVFHDEGNVNFGVICPPATFDRDRHAEMVVRALHRLGRPTTRVNERHDIVMDTGDHASSSAAAPRTFKVSGSAYKLTRLRSLHHGTCLARSPNLSSISRLLRSPAEPYVLARGVDSVRSPVANVDVDVDAFRDAVVDEFRAMYGAPDICELDLDPAAHDSDALRAGRRELASRDWVYAQTPKFSFSTYPTPEDPRPRPVDLPLDAHLRFTARRGVIEEAQVTDADGAQFTLADEGPHGLVGASVHDVDDWPARLARAGLASAQADRLGSWVAGVLGTRFTKDHLR